MALLLFAMIFIGLTMVATAGPLYTILLGWHRTVGTLLFFLFAVRLALRAFLGSPALPANLPSWQVGVARLTQVALYVLMAVLPISGWAMLSAGGYPIVLFGGLRLPPVAPHDLGLFALFRGTHTVLASCFFAAALAHIAAALHHAIRRKDGVFASMSPPPFASYRAVVRTAAEDSS
jgi:cytochrome b561